MNASATSVRARLILSELTAKVAVVRQWLGNCAQQQRTAELRPASD